jgi:pSer/pThr/pTyr-binding forkhead associated (FHA) protein
MAKIIVSDKGRESLYEVMEDTVVIGASRECNLQVRDPKAAHIHCQIRRSPRGWKLVDLETKSGTMVNGTIVNQHDLASGDEIRIGDVVLRFEAGAEPARAPASPPPRRASSSARPVATARAAAPARRTTRAAAADEDDEDALPQIPLEKSGPPPALVALVISGVLLAALLGWLLFSKGSVPDDVRLLREAHTLYDAGHIADAELKLKEIDRYTELSPGVQADKTEFEKKIQQHADEAAKKQGFKVATKENDEAVAEGNAIVQAYYHLPLKPKRDKIEEIRRRVQEYCVKYKDSPDNVERVQKVIPLLDKRLAELANSPGNSDYSDE